MQNQLKGLGQLSVVKSSVELMSLGVRQPRSEPASDPMSTLCSEHLVCKIHVGRPTGQTCENE